MTPASRLSLIAATALVSGCVSDRITNLTPPELPRDPHGLYRVEAEFTSRQQSLRWDSARAVAVVGQDTYPLRRTPQLTNRWEGAIPVSADQDHVHYRFRWDFDRQGFGRTHPNTARSPQYRLQIADR